MAVDAPSHPNAGPVEAGTDVEGDLPDASRRMSLLDDCREMVVSRMSKVIAEALKRLGDELTELALKSPRRDEQQALMDAVAVVRQNRVEIEVSFRRAFGECFQRRLFDQDSVPAAAALGELAELKLVDDDAMDEKLTVDRVVHRARGKLDPDEVLGIRARLGALLQREWFDESGHPAAPEAVFEALKRALGQVAGSREVQTALLDALEPHVSANLNQVYSTVNERLKAQHILPRIRPQVALNASGSRRAGEPLESLAHGDPAAARAAARIGNVAGRYPAGFDPLAASLPAGVFATPGSPAMPGPFAPGGGGHGALGVQGTHGALGGQSAGGERGTSIDATLRQLAAGVPAARLSVARMLTDPSSFGVADLPLPAVEPPLIESIGRMQAETTETPLTGSRLFTDLLERTREKGSPLDQLTVEIVSLVFDYIYADKRLSDTIKQQLLRLQVVAVKAALLDRSFFARRQHPMRRLIDRITELASDPDTDLLPGSPMVTGLEALIGWILAEFDRDLETFAAALAKLEELVAEEAERRALRLAQLTREAERREALVAARKQAGAMLADRVDPVTPPFIAPFLADWWADVVAQASLAEEAGAMRAADCVQIAEALVWSVAPKLPDEISRLASLLPKLIGGLMRGLKTIDIPAEQREAFFNELLRVHTAAIEAAKSGATQQAGAARARSRVRMRSDGSIHFQPSTDAKAAAAAAPVPAAPAAADEAANDALERVRAADVQRGDRIEIEDENGVRRFKLAWISPSKTLYVLSRFPDEARSLDAAAFADLFDSGKARVVERRSTVDHAISMIAVSPMGRGQPRAGRTLH